MVFNSGSKQYWRTTSGFQTDGRTYANLIVQNNSDNSLVTLRFKLPNVKMAAAEFPFSADGHQFGAGAIVGSARPNRFGSAPRPQPSWWPRWGPTRARRYSASFVRARHS